MLPSFLVSSYQQYKDDTDAIAGWLASTAKRCGYAADLLQPEPAAAPRSQRLKGKARKQARETSKAGESSSRSPAQPAECSAAPTKRSYIISVNDFIALAEFIAGSAKPSVKVPATVVTILDRAISTRKQHARALSAHQDGGQRDEESDKSHSYFVGVLERVKEILRPRMRTATTGDILAQEPGKAEEEVDELRNSFAGLDIQEPSEAFENAPDIAQPSRAEPDYRAEQIQDIEEACTTFELLLEDINRLRAAISKVWIGYKMGKYDIISASITTNSAIEFARRLEEDAASILEKHRGVEHMLKIYYHSVCFAQGQDPNYRAQPDDALNFEVYEAVDSFMWPAYELLRSYVSLVSRGNIPVYKAGFYGTYDPSSDRRRKSTRERFQEDQILLMEILPEFALLCRTQRAIPAEDELIRGLRTAFDTKKISLWTVFAVQTFVDVHHRMREDVWRSALELENAAKQIEGSIEEHFKFHASLRVDTWPRSNDAFFRDLQHRINNWVKGDPVMEASRRLNRPLPEEHNLLRKHPVYCGLLAYSLKIQFHEVGIALANAWGSIMYSGHLYNAVRMQGLLRDAWKDMEIVRIFQTDEMFAGKPPSTPEDFIKSYMLSIGYAASNFAPNRRGTRPLASQRGPRGLREKAPVAHVFKERYCNGSRQANFKDDDLRKILGNINAWEEDLDVSDQENEQGEPVEKFGLTKDPKPRNRKAARAHQGATGRLTMPELLEKLGNALQGEVFELSFDYLMMHRFCWRLLRTVKEECAGKLRQMYGPSYIEKESQLPFVVGYIFMAAASGNQFNNDLLHPRRTEEVTSELLEKAAEVLMGMINACAGSIVAKVLEMQYNITFEEED